MTDALSTPSNPLAAWARRAPLIAYLTGTFVWAWALWGYWIPAMPPGGLVISPAFIVCAIVGGLAPSLAAIATSWLMGGRAETARLLGAIAKWRTPPLNYALALGIVPAATLVSVILQSLLLGPLKPVDPALLAMALIWPVMAALGEELGWRGFLFPRLVPRLGLVGAAIVVGLIWGLWHLPADYVALKAYGGLFWLAFLLNGPFVLTAHALIMAWLWRRSGGNLLLMLIYHWSITASAMLTPVAGGQDWIGLASAALGGSLMWLIALGLWRLTPAAAHS